MLAQNLAELALTLDLEQFLDGRTDGAALLQTLYGPVAEEPVPEHLLALIRRPRLALIVDNEPAPAAPVTPSHWDAPSCARARR
jgi:hypothetical protein